MEITSKRQFIEVKDVGKGAFGRCVLAKTNGNVTVVVKEIKFEQFALRRPSSTGSAATNSNTDETFDEENSEMIQMIRAQGPLLAKLKHPNIVRGFGSFDEDGIFYVVTEYCHSGDLWRAILDRKVKGNVLFSEEQLLSWGVQLALAVSYLHDHFIIHRDIKPSNIFLENQGRTIKLGSFGIAKQLTSADDCVIGQIGTMTHMPPEMVEGRAISLKGDVWSYGVTLYELASLTPPFDNANPVFLCREISQKTARPLPAKFSEELLHLIETKLLNKEPSSRPTMCQVLAEQLFRRTIAEMISERQQIIMGSMKA